MLGSAFTLPSSAYRPVPGGGVRSRAALSKIVAPSSTTGLLPSLPILPNAEGRRLRHARRLRARWSQSVLIQVPERRRKKEDFSAWSFQSSAVECGLRSGEAIVIKPALCVFVLVATMRPPQAKLWGEVCAAQSKCWAKLGSIKAVKMTFCSTRRATVGLRLPRTRRKHRIHRVCSGSALI